MAAPAPSVAPPPRAGEACRQLLTSGARAPTTATRVKAAEKNAAGRATHDLTRTDGHLRLRRLRFDCLSG